MQSAIRLSRRTTIPRNFVRHSSATFTGVHLHSQHFRGAVQLPALYICRFKQTQATAIHEPVASEHAAKAPTATVWQYQWIYRKANGKIRKLLVVGVAFVVISIAHHLTMKSRMHTGSILALTLARTIYYIDQDGYSRTNFDDYLSTLAYFRALLLVALWVREQRNSWRAMHGTLQAKILRTEDFDAFRESVDRTFQKLVDMADGPKRRAFHRKMRTTCRDVHSFINEFNTFDPDLPITSLYNMELEQMNMQQKMVVMMAGFGTMVLIRTAWWFRPKY